MVGTGTCTINANQAGNANYAAAPQVSQSFAITQATQTISFTAPGNSTYNAVVSLVASATSGLPITFSSATTSICTVSGSNATLVGIGDIWGRSRHNRNLRGAMHAHHSGERLEARPVFV